MTETLKASGQDMEQEPPEELDGIEGHQPLTVAMGIVFPPKGHPPIRQGHQTTMRDRHAVGIAREILQYLSRATGGWLGIHHPLRGLERAQELLPPRVRSEGVASPFQRQSACRVRLPEPGEEPPTEHATQHTDRQEEGRATGPPLRPVGRQPTPRHHTVEVGMMVERLPPSMPHREKPDLRPQMARVASHGQEGLGHGLKEEVIEHPRVLEREWAEGMWEGKHHMDVGDIEQLRFASRKPGRLRPAWTLGAMPIATGVLGDLHVATLVTLRRMPPESRRAANRDRPEGVVLLRGQGLGIACQIGVAILAHHVRHFEGGAVHKDSSSGNASRGLGVAWRACGVTWR